LTKLYDGMIEHLDDMWGDEEFTESGSDFTDEIMEIISEDPLGNEVEEDEGGWEDILEDDEATMDVDHTESQNSKHPPSSTTSTAVATPARSSTPQPPLLTPSISHSHHASSGATESSAPQNQPSEMPYDRFKVLPSAPEDHAFRAAPPGQPSRNFMTRLNKEYRVLGSSLPGQSHTLFHLNTSHSLQ
jgi:ubiquitin-conjugating enzyme E2 O